MFQYKYVDRVEIKEEESDHIYVGNVIHESIEEYLKNCDLMEDDEIIKSILEEEKQELYEEYPYNRADFEEKVQTCLETSSRYLAKFLPNSGVKDVEERWTMQDEKFKSIEWVGYADLVRDDDCIVDWKTGKPMGDKKELVQSGVYAKLFENEYGYPPDTVEFVYLSEGEKSSHSPLDWSNYWQQIHGMAKKIVREEKVKDEFDATPKDDSVCHWCDYKNICSEYVGAEKVKAEHIQIGI